MEIPFGHRHCTQKFRLQKTYELRIRVLSKSHMISKPLRHRLHARFAWLRDWMIHVRCRTSWPHIACTVQGMPIARCDDCTENWSKYVTIARVRLQHKYFYTHFLCAPQDWCIKRSPLHGWNDIQCTCVAMISIAIHAQAMVTLHKYMYVAASMWRSVSLSYTF